MKRIIREKLGDNYLILARMKAYVVNRVNLVVNFIIDLVKYYKHSNVFSNNSFQKIEASIILDYHGLEKGFLNKNIKPRFAQERVKSLISNLKKIEKENVSSNQIDVARSILKKYYEFHENIDVAIDDYFSKDDLIQIICSEDLNPVIAMDKIEYMKSINLPFDQFSMSRKSIRFFKNDIIESALLRQVMDLAKYAPSVCNRQATRVYYSKNYDLVQELLGIQGGMRGYKENINQLLVVTVDRNYFYTVGERNQLYIDGGIFLMNLLYSLHFYGIGACCANWGKEYKDDLRAAKLLKLKPSEKIICVVVIGFCEDNLKFTLSKRRDSEEIFKEVN